MSLGDEGLRRSVTFSVTAHRAAIPPMPKSFLESTVSDGPRAPFRQPPGQPGGLPSPDDWHDDSATIASGATAVSGGPTALRQHSLERTRAEQSVEPTDRGPGRAIAHPDAPTRPARLVLH